MGVGRWELGYFREARVEKILLSQVAKFRAEFARDFQMIIDDKSDVCAFCDWQNFFRRGAYFFGRTIFGAQLDQVAAAVTELLRDEFGRAAMQIGRVHEGVKFAVCERFHENNLTANHAKYTKDSAAGSNVFLGAEVTRLKLKLFRDSSRRLLRFKIKTAAEKISTAVRAKCFFTSGRQGSRSGRGTVRASC